VPTIIANLDSMDYEHFDINRMQDYKNAHLIIVNQNKIVYDNGKTNDIYKEGGLIAPNGNVSNLTRTVQVSSYPQFKAWFGDWENDPANASKVVDGNGEPKVVYRGSTIADNVGNVFNYNLNRFDNRNTNRFGFYFTESRNVADRYANQEIGSIYYDKKEKKTQRNN